MKQPADTGVNTAVQFVQVEPIENTILVFPGVCECGGGERERERDLIRTLNAWAAYAYSTAGPPVMDIDSWERAPHNTSGAILAECAFFGKLIGKGKTCLSLRSHNRLCIAHRHTALFRRAARLLCQ